MTQAQLLEIFNGLPPDKQQLVLDFIDFLISRSKVDLQKKECLADHLLMMPNVGLDEDFARGEL
ncbi:MAG: hypothetical protein NT070_09580 [Cyanobacteria bacterium]|nr:hypothetical protein [Cyanobacteriota bacterium]